jgi:hypothetical protein
MQLLLSEILILSANYIVITNCTSRKRAGARPLRFGKQILGADLKETAQRWRRELRLSTAKVPISHLYVGRSISSAKWVAAKLCAPLYVVSAGLGLVGIEDEAPAYDLSIAGADGRLQRALDRFNERPAAWWSLLIRNGGLRELAARNPGSVMLIALPAAYMEMVSDDLASCSSRELSRIRIFTSIPGRAVLPQELAQNVIPYDDRLESVRGYSGTRADYPQRAMRHFVEQLGAHRLSIHQSLKAVNRSLGQFAKPQKIERRREDDEVIKRLIRRQWHATGGRSGVLLRYLRDDALVSCEQARFAKLCKEIRHEATLARRELL